MEVGAHLDYGLGHLGRGEDGVCRNHPVWEFLGTVIR